MKTAKISIRRNKNGEKIIYLNDMELETAERVFFNISREEGRQNERIEIIIDVPALDIEAGIEDIHLSTGAYMRCEVCGRWIIPSIAKNLKEKTVVAEYKCSLPGADGEPCNWKKSVKIQNWNEGLKKVKPTTEKDLIIKQMEADIDGGK